jgi:CubicO group peptidase (beta-lactamase class C family)
MFAIALAVAAAHAAGDAAGAAAATKAPDEKMLKAAWDYNVSVGGQTMVVMHQGKVIFEQYANGGGRARLQALASGSKSFVGVAAAAAVQDGLIQFDEKASQTLPEWKADSRKARITLRQLLHQTDGLDPGENLASSTRTTWEQGVTAVAISDPGTKFRYGPNHFFAFGEVLQRKLMAGKYRTFQEYLNKRILAPIGIQVRWLRLADGNPNLPGGAMMTARDWAKFGEFVRQGGKWEGKSIVEEKTLHECFVGDSVAPYYGLTWWLRGPMGEQGQALAQLPTDDKTGEQIICAAGLGGQRLFIIRSRELVVVRNARVMDRNEFSDKEFLQKLLTESN